MPTEAASAVPPALSSPRLSESEVWDELWPHLNVRLKKCVVGFVKVALALSSDEAGNIRWSQLFAEPECLF